VNGVNLLPEPQGRSVSWEGARKPLAVVAAVGVIAGVGVWGLSLRSQVGGVEEDVAAATAERDALQAQLGAYYAAVQAKGPEELRRGAVIALAAGRINWERIIRNVSATAPREIWLTMLRGETETAEPGVAAAPDPAAGGAAPRGLHLEGYAFQHSQVAALMTRLDVVAGLGEPRLASSEGEDLEGQRVVKFVIDVPVDKRVQDRPTLVPASGTAPATTGAVTP
jgi:hypothetical protein